LANQDRFLSIAPVPPLFSPSLPPSSQFGSTSTLFQPSFPSLPNVSFLYIECADDSGISFFFFPSSFSPSQLIRWYGQEFAQLPFPPCVFREISCCTIQMSKPFPPPFFSLFPFIAPPFIPSEGKLDVFQNSRLSQTIFFPFPTAVCTTKMLGYWRHCLVPLPFVAPSRKGPFFLFGYRSLRVELVPPFFFFLSFSFFSESVNKPDLRISFFSPFQMAYPHRE